MATVVTCPYCGTDNLTAECSICSRHFVLTTAIIEDRLRAFADEGLAATPPQYTPVCDFDRAKELGVDAAELVTQGLRQRTCVDCKTAFLYSDEQ